MLALALLLLIPLALDVALLDQSLDALRGEDDTGGRSENEIVMPPLRRQATQFVLATSLTILKAAFGVRRFSAI